MAGGARVDQLVLDEFGYLPFATVGPTAVPPHQPPLRTNLQHRHDQPRRRPIANPVRRSQDDDGALALRHSRDRQRAGVPSAACEPTTGQALRTRYRSGVRSWSASWTQSCIRKVGDHLLPARAAPECLGRKGFSTHLNSRLCLQTDHLCQRD